MSPRYEVEVTPERAEDYEKYIEGINGKILKKRLSLEETKAIIDKTWSEQSTEARSLVDSMLQASEPLAKNRILAGLIRLIGKAGKLRTVSNVGLSIVEKIPTREIDFSVLRDALGTSLLNELPETPPVWIDWDSKHSNLLRRQARKHIEVKGIDIVFRHPHPVAYRFF